MIVTFNGCNFNFNLNNDDILINRKFLTNNIIYLQKI